MRGIVSQHWLIDKPVSPPLDAAKGYSTVRQGAVQERSRNGCYLRTKRLRLVSRSRPRISAAPDPFRIGTCQGAGDFRQLGDRTDRDTRDYVSVLVSLIADYEKRARHAIDTSHVTAADLVRHKIEQRGMSVSELAKQIGIAQSNLSEMLNGSRGWSKSAIKGISKLLNIRAERFL
jgi:antitoxin component HigA of HigAB toxin-antitoxin module